MILEMVENTLENLVMGPLRSRESFARYASQAKHSLQNLSAYHPISIWSSCERWNFNLKIFPLCHTDLCFSLPVTLSGRHPWKNFRKSAFTSTSGILSIFTSGKPTLLYRRRLPVWRRSLSPLHQSQRSHSTFPA